MPTQIILIRHGETEWNRIQRIQGFRDVALSRAGEKQAQRLAKRLKKIKIHAAYSSDLVRSTRSAEIALKGSGCYFETSPALRERCFGEWEGLLWKDIERKFPRHARAFSEDPVGFVPPGGETWNQMQTRVFQKVEEAAARHPNQTVCIFTHGGPCKAAILAALNLPSIQWRSWVAANASLHRLVCQLSPGASRPTWKLTGFNDVAHLEETIPTETLTNLNEKAV